MYTDCKISDIWNAWNRYEYIEIHSNLSKSLLKHAFLSSSVRIIPSSFRPPPHSGTRVPGSCDGVFFVKIMYSYRFYILIKFMFSPL